jgi:hypothetical protein
MWLRIGFLINELFGFEIFNFFFLIELVFNLYARSYQFSIYQIFTKLNLQKDSAGKRKKETGKTKVFYNEIF